MTGGTNGPMLKAPGLWAKSSVKGGQYLSGRLCGLKVLVLENRDRQGDDEPSHHLFFVEAPDRRQKRHGSAQERGDGQGARLSSQKPSTPHRRGFQGHADGETEDGRPWEP